LRVRNASSGGGNWDFLTIADGNPVEGAGKVLIADRNANQIRMAVDTSGKVGIGTVFPTAKLEVAGTIKANNKTVVVGEETLRIVRGLVSSNGVALKGTGFTVTSNAIGAFTVTFSAAFSDLPAVKASAVVPPPGTQGNVAD
jgi:hypothetical protein